jgi:hypothetical protein
VIIVDKYRVAIKRMLEALRSADEGMDTPGLSGRIFNGMGEDVGGEIDQARVGLSIALKELSLVNKLVIGSVWVHKSGAKYKVIAIANTDAEDKNKWPDTVTYQSSDRKVWSRPIESFLEEFHHEDLVKKNGDPLTRW